MLGKAWHHVMPAGDICYLAGPIRQRGGSGQARGSPGMGRPGEATFADAVCVLCRRPSAADPRPESGLLAMSRLQPGDIDIMRFKRGKIIDPDVKLGAGGKVFGGMTVSR